MNEIITTYETLFIDYELKMDPNVNTELYYEILHSTHNTMTT